MNKDNGIYLLLYALLCGMSYVTTAQTSVPPNDNLATASRIPEANLDGDTLRGTSIGANQDDVGANALLDDIESFPRGGSSVWYKFTAPAAIGIAEPMQIELVSKTVGFSPMIGVYRGTDDIVSTFFPGFEISDVSAILPTFVQIVEEDTDTLVQEIPIDQGETYWICIDGQNGGTGDFDLILTIDPGSRPMNDDFEDRIVLFGSQIQTIEGFPAFTMFNSSGEIGEDAFTTGLAPTDDYSYSHLTDTANNPEILANSAAVTADQFIGSVWYSWSTPFDGSVTIEVDGFPGYVNVWTGSNIGSLQIVATGANNTEVVFNAVRGVSYQIQIVYTRPNQTLLADGYEAFPGGIEEGDPDPVGNGYVLSISMFNNAPQILINNPRDDQTFALQTLTVSTFFEDQEGSIVTAPEEPIFNDPSILPFVDRVRFFAQFLGSAENFFADGDANPSIIGVDETFPYSIQWRPSKRGRWVLTVESEDDQYGFDPITGNNIVTSVQAGPNFLGPVTITILESINAPTTAPTSPLTDAGTLVDEIYMDITGAPPTDQQRIDGINALDGGTTPAELADAVLSTSSGQTLLQARLQIIRLFQAFFNRLPSLNEFDTFSSSLASVGTTLLDIGNQLATSTEFQNLYENLSDTAFVRAIFANLGSPTGTLNDSFWTGLLSAGDTRGEVATKMTEPESFGIDASNPEMGNFEEITAIYFIFYKRQPTSDELESAGSTLSLLQDYFGSSDFAIRFVNDPNPTVETIGNYDVVVDKIDGFVYLIDPNGGLVKTFGPPENGTDPNVTQNPIPVDRYTDWTARENTNNGTPLVDLADETADSEAGGTGDGVNNITEYAFEALGFNSNANDSALLPATQMVGTTFQIDYAVDVSKIDASVIVEYSDNGMLTFNEIDPANPPAGFTVENIAVGGNTIVFKRVSVDTSVCSSCFFRIRVESNL